MLALNTDLEEDPQQGQNKTQTCRETSLVVEGQGYHIITVILRAFDECGIKFL